MQADPDAQPSWREAASAPPQDNLLTSARVFLVSLLAHLRSRLELLGIELAQERLRLSAALMLGAFALVLGILALVLVVLLVLAIVWNTPYRLPAIGAMLAVAVVVAITLAVLAQRRLVSGARLFQASLRELTRDQHWLDRSQRP